MDLKHSSSLLSIDHFLAGKRACPGEAMARCELFMIFSRLMQDFTLSASPDHPRPTRARLEGAGISPPVKFHAVATPRRRGEIAAEGMNAD